MEKRELAVKLTETMLVITIMFMAYGAVPPQVRAFAALCWIIFALIFGFVETYSVKKNSAKRTPAKIRREKREKRLRKIGRFFLGLLDPTKMWVVPIGVAFIALPMHFIWLYTQSITFMILAMFAAMAVIYISLSKVYKRLY